MKNYKKYKVKALNGFVYIEKYMKGKEWDRAKIYDENFAYLDYILLDGKTRKEYKHEIERIINSKNDLEFIECGLGIDSFDYSDNLEYLLYSMFDDATEELFDKVEQDLKDLTEQEIIDKYEINRVGNTYMYLNY